MSKLLYVEPTDEITDLVDRIRRATDERDLVFVVPQDARALHSPLDLQLLMQYTRGFQKRLAIVSGDPQVQALAIRTGFATYTSLAQMEQGVALTGARVAERAAAAATAAVATAPAAAPPKVDPGSPVSPSPQRGLSKRGPSALVAKPPPPSGGNRLSRLWHNPSARNWLIGGGAGVFVVGVLAVLLLLPTAQVVVGVQSHKINDPVTIQGNLAGASSGVLDVIPTQALLTPAASQSFTVTPSGTQVLPPTPATGSLELCLNSSGGSGSASLTFQASPNFQVTSGGGNLGFTTTSAGQAGTYTVYSCKSGQTSTPPIPVQATTTSLGTQGNVASGQQWSWTNANSSACVAGFFGCQTVTSADFTVSNPSAMSGGQNSKTQQVFTSSDISSAQQQEQQLASTLTSQVEHKLKSMAGSETIAQDSSGNGIQVTVNNPTLPTVGQAGSAEKLTVSVTAAATAYSPQVAKQAVLKDLRSKVPSDGQLLAHPSLGTLQVVAAGPGGSLTLSTNAVGYWAPKVDLSPYRSKLAFMNPGAARSYLLSQLPGASTVTVHQSPFSLPWLPLLSGRIQLTRQSLGVAGAA